MKVYCVKFRKDTGNIDPESKGLLSNLGIKIPLNKIPLLNVLL